jgi:hypothetical protein
MKKEMGKIESVRFGHGGYQDSMLGLSVTLSMNGSGVSDFKGTWDAELVKHTEYSRWTEEDRDKSYSDTMRFLSKLLSEAKVDEVSKLKGTPVEVTLDGILLKEWRVLTEVL